MSQKLPPVKFTRMCTRFLKLAFMLSLKHSKTSPWDTTAWDMGYFAASLSKDQTKD